MLGILVGLVAEGVVMANIQSYISIILGIGLLVIAFFSINVETKILQSPIFGQWFLRLKLNLGKLLKSNTYPTFYKIGLLNGFLPCGLVYMAVIGAIAMDNLVNSTVYMIVFGLGTIPLMLLTAVSGQFIGFKFRKRMHKFYPVFFVFFAVLLIMRGLNFEMPPAMEFWDSLKHEAMCF